MSKYILGLDLGSNSIGWAMLGLDGDSESSTQATGFFDTSGSGHPPMGVRIFEEGLENFDSSKEKSLCQSRRIARSMRRNHSRKNARRKALRRTLTKAGLLPKDLEQLEKTYRTNPYEIRCRALDQKVTEHELGRAIYHLCQRRGFQSNRKSGESKEDKGMLLSIGELAKEIKTSGSRTLGEYLYTLSLDEPDKKSHLKTGNIRIRKRHTRRNMHKEELHEILEVQKHFYSEILTEDLIHQIQKIAFFQHPFELTEERRKRAPSRANLHRAPSVKPCPLEPDNKCCARGEWKAQQFRILKEVNNLRIAENFGLERELDPKERDTVINLLSVSKEVKFDNMRKELAKLGVDPDAKFNLERGDRGKLIGNTVEHKIRSAFGKKAWANLPEGDKTVCRTSLLAIEDPEELKNLFIEKGMAEAKAEKLSKFAPPDGYIGYSFKAINKLLPHLQEGRSEYEAIALTYPDRPESHQFDKLPALSEKSLPHDLQNITNPIVRRALVECRKVVNAIVREHGKPSLIIVELARNMKANQDERKKIIALRNKNEKRRIEAKEFVSELGGNPNSRSDINRRLMWSEQGGICVYTGKTIPPSDLFSGEWEVEHILPRWRSLDDSYLNKVLVQRSANADKGDRTVIQWLGKDSQEFRHIIQRAEGMVQKGFPNGKLNRLKQESISTDGFAQRQLNDTRYISRSVVEYLNLLYSPEKRKGEQAVLSCRGGLTAELRRQWGLNNVLDVLIGSDGKPVLSIETDENGQPKKSRSDHRHHAIDAVVIALSSRSYLKRYQDFRKKHARAQATPRFNDPWPEFRNDVISCAQEINVSHRPVRKISGELHKETFYGPSRNNEGQLVSDTYSTRKNIEDLTGKSVEQIKDNQIRKRIKAELLKQGWNGETKLPDNWWGNGIYINSRNSKIPIYKVRIELPMSKMVHLGHRFAQSGSNHHIEIIENTKDNEKQIESQIVSRFEATHRVRRLKIPAICREPSPGKRFIMSLSRKESVQLTNPTTGCIELCVVQKISIPFDICLRDAKDSRPASEGNRTPFVRVASKKLWTQLDIRKVQVDPLGRINKAND